MDHSAATAAGGGRAGRRCKLVLLTPRTQIARNELLQRIGIHRRLYQAEAQIVVAAEPISLQRHPDMAQCLHGRRADRTSA